MFISIRYKLFATLLTAVFVVVIGMFYLVHLSFDRGFLNYVNTVESKRLDSLALDLQDAYAGQKDWDFLQNNPRLWRQFLAASTPEGHQQFDPLENETHSNQRKTRRNTTGQKGASRQGRKIPRRFREELKHLFEFRVALMDTNKNVIIGSRQLPPNIKMIPLLHESIPVGYLGHLAQKNVLAQHELQFVQKQKKSFAIISFIIAALAALISFPLASRMVKRINALAHATHTLAAGQFDERLNIGSEDELGQLTHDFNALALTLGKNEESRKQWVADISHELRTPLAVLRGEIEALQEGVRQSTPEAMGSLHAEVLRLNRLVDDLFQLSLSDLGALTYQKEIIDVGQILTKAVNSYKHEFFDKNISIDFDVTPEHKLPFFGDSERLLQLFDNLLNNSLKYTERDGRLTVHCQLKGRQTEILFQDSSPGVPAADCNHLFERLYRVESSRNRSTGGAGLGLAICKNIVEAHGGTITAKPSPLGGVTIRVTLPSGERP